MDTTKEFIMCAAIHKKGEEVPHQPKNIKEGTVYCGFNHAAIIQQTKLKNSEQGFLTSKNRFVNREEAAKIAFDCGQLSRKKKNLFSEDLWSQVEEKSPGEEYTILYDMKREGIPTQKIKIDRVHALIIWKAFEKLHGLQIETIDQRESRGGFIFFSELLELSEKNLLPKDQIDIDLDSFKNL